MYRMPRRTVEGVARDRVSRTKIRQLRQTGGIPFSAQFSSASLAEIASVDFE
jgi:hypothetical protein